MCEFIININTSIITIIYYYYYLLLFLFFCLNVKLYNKTIKKNKRIL